MVENEEEEEIASNEEAYADEEERLICLLHRVYLTPNTLEKSQMHNLFRIRGP